jgi:predicted transposase YbfD/YdcC
MAKGFQNSVKATEKRNHPQLTSSFLEESFLQNFSALNDPRIERSKEHLLIDIVAISILAVISGAEGWVAIETYGKAKSQWLKQFLSLPNGIPSHDTFSRVWARIDPSEFQGCFQTWVNSITKKLGVEVIAIDGKTLKQSYDRQAQQKALHIVSAWSSSHQLVLGQKKVNDKSNEITAIPALIEMLEIEGGIVTIDAMGCQKEITRLIRQKKGDYIIALKANQQGLYQEIKEWFEGEGLNNGEHSYDQQIETGHHRIEKREVIAVSVSNLPSLRNQSLWTDFKTVVMVKSERKLWNKTTTEVRFYISSVEKDAKKIGRAIRSHWGIENSLHWTLDVTFSEDNSRIRKDNAPENFALLRRLAVNLLNRKRVLKEVLR